MIEADINSKINYVFFYVDNFFTRQFVVWNIFRLNIDFAIKAILMEEK